MALAPSPTAAATRFIDRVQAAERGGRLPRGRVDVGYGHAVPVGSEAADHGGAEAIRPAGDQDRP